jgi:hypothetical protein
MSMRFSTTQEPAQRHQKPGTLPVLQEFRRISRTPWRRAPCQALSSYLTFCINALILCDDSHFLKTLERVFVKLGVRSE